MENQLINLPADYKIVDNWDDLYFQPNAAIICNYETLNQVSIYYWWDLERLHEIVSKHTTAILKLKTWKNAPR